MGATVATVNETLQTVLWSWLLHAIFVRGAAAWCSSPRLLSPLKVKDFLALRSALGAAAWCSKRLNPAPEGRKHQYFQDGGK